MQIIRRGLWIVGLYPVPGAFERPAPGESSGSQRAASGDARRTGNRSTGSSAGTGTRTNAGTDVHTDRETRDLRPDVLLYGWLGEDLHPAAVTRSKASNILANLTCL